jgi:hypothetical protein
MRATTNQAIDSVEKELIDATQFVPEKRYRKRQDYLAALMRAVCDLPDPDFDKLSDEAADWGCRAVDAFRAGAELPDFDNTVKSDHEEVNERIVVHKDEVIYERGEDGIEAESTTEEDLIEDAGQEEVKAEPHETESVEGEVGEEVAPEQPAKKKPGRPKGKAKTKEVKAKAVKEKEIKPKKDSAPKVRQMGVNKWGVLKGSKSDTVCQMLARDEGATMEEIRDVTGHYHYNLCNRLKRHGFNISKNGLRIYLKEGPPPELDI